MKSDGTNDNLNLGSAVVDGRTGAVLLQWGGCVHCGCTGTVPKPAVGDCEDKHPMGNVRQIRSSDSLGTERHGQGLANIYFSLIY